MKIKDYEFNKEHISCLNEIVDTADKWFEALNKITMHNITYNEELYEIYHNYITALNEQMSTFLDIMKKAYDKVDVLKAVFKNDESLYQKINIALKKVEQVFDTYYYMLDKIKMLREEYFEEYVNFKARYLMIEYDEEQMKQTFNYICPLHYNLINQMNDFATNIAQPQVDILDAIYKYEMDFNKALNLTDFEPKGKV